MNVILQCAGKLEPCIKQFLLSLMLGESTPVNSQVQYHRGIYDLYYYAPYILLGVLPYVIGEPLLIYLALLLLCGFNSIKFFLCFY